MSVYALYGPKGHLTIADGNKDGIFNAVTDGIKTAPESNIDTFEISNRLAGMGLDLNSLEGVRLKPLSEYLDKLTAAEHSVENDNADLMDMYLNAAKKYAAEAGVRFDTTRANTPKIRECYRQGAKELVRRGQKECDGYEGKFRQDCLVPYVYRVTVFRELGGTYSDNLLSGFPMAKKIFFGLMYMGTLSGIKRNISEGNLTRVISTSIKLLNIYAEKGGFNPDPAVQDELYKMGYERELKEAEAASSKFDRDMSIDIALKWAEDGGIKIDRVRIAKIRRSKLGHDSPK